MDAFEFSKLLLTNKISQLKSDVIDEETGLATGYLGQLMMLHKYLDFLFEQDKKNRNLKKIQIFNLTRIIEGFVTSNHMLTSRNYNAALTELRTIYETLNIIRAVTISKEYLLTYLSQDAMKILWEFQPLRIRKMIGSTPYDVVHNFLISYQTHPFYDGNEYLLSIDVSSKAQESSSPNLHNSVLDIVVSIMILISYLHTYFQVATSFGISSLIPADKDILLQMFSNVEKFLRKYYDRVKNHRFIATVIEDFMKTFIGLINANLSVDTEEINFSNKIRKSISIPKNHPDNPENFKNYMD